MNATTDRPHSVFDVVLSLYFRAVLALPTPAALTTTPLRIVQGAVLVLFGLPGCLKTYTALFSAVQLALNGSRVLWVAGEGTARALVARIASLVAGLGRPLEDLADRFLLVVADFDLLDPEPNAFLEKLTIQHRPDLVVMDPLTSFVRGDENDASVFKQRLSEINQWRAANIAVLLIHHSRKQMEGRAPELRGSSTIRAAADSVVLVERPDMSSARCRVVVQKARDEEPAPPQLVEFRFDPLGATVSVREDLGEHESGILGVLTESDSPMTRTEIREVLGCSGKTVGGALMKLLSRGLVRKTAITARDEKGRARSHEAFSLA